jgi:hypothetical protein
VRLRLTILAVAAITLGAPLAAQGYSAELDPSGNGIAEQIAREATEKAERASAEEKERRQRELAASEARSHAEAEKALAEAQAGETTWPASPTVWCVVPTLTGDSLARAQVALRAAHCKVGHITTRRGTHVVVTRQSVAGGRRLAQGSAISLTLRPRKR